ncbi:hypothetical protein C8R43DRAFT_1139825 [Mycena crocata]|nr:hypothetical protein C8R43DRAFT_1139825 [Mycena crocata]
MAQNRGAKLKDLGMECLVHPTTGQVACNTCKKASGAEMLTYINRVSWKTHIHSPTHWAATQKLMEQDSLEKATRQQYFDIYSMNSTSLQDPGMLNNTGNQRARFRPILDEDTNGIRAADFEDVVMQEIEAFTEPDPVDLAAENVEAIRRELEILRLEHLEQEFEGVDDETIPQFADEIRGNTAISGDGDDEDAINEHFTGVPRNHNYAPYGNKTMCYLDILDNLPRLRLSYIHEVTELADGRWAIAVIWIVSKGIKFAECRLVDTMADDVSGARSKQYQKHLNIYTANANLPGQLLQQEYNVRFISTSPHAGSLEQLKVVVNHVKSTHVQPIRTYDADTSRPCGVHLNVPDGPADNPQQAEEASHIGHQGLYFCRRCHVGGSHEERECPNGYHAFYEASFTNDCIDIPLTFMVQAGQPHSVQEIRSCVLSQLRLATYGVAAPVIALQTATGTKDKIAQHWIDILIPKAREMHTETPSRSVDDISNALLAWLNEQTDQPYNPLLDLPFFDPSQDTLVEILHTILLGDAKYTWYELHHNWTPAQQDLFTVRLQSTNLDGLRVPPIRAAYMMQYRNRLIGKHFKTLMQTMIFHIEDIVTPDQFTLVRALGELGALLWISVIDDMDEYLADLQILIDNLLDAFASLDPSKILIKLKLHILVHIIQDIRRRGPSVRFSTEVFECFNAIFDFFADLDRVKHILSGGYWVEDGEWVHAGKDVHRILRNAPIIQRHIGWAPPPIWTPGHIKAMAQKKQNKLAVLTAEETMLGDATNPTSIAFEPGALWAKAVNVSSVSDDSCTVGSFAVFRVNNLPMIARISTILLPHGSKSAQGILVVSKYDVVEARHPRYHMPVLLPNAAGSCIVVPSNAPCPGAVIYQQPLIALEPQ